MTSEQAQTKERRIMLQNQIQQAYNDIKGFRGQLGEIAYQCKHDGSKTWEQSASGNESFYICDICGDDCD